MLVKNVPKLLEIYSNLNLNPDDLSFEFSEPWYFNKENAGHVPFGSSSGVYIYTEVTDNWETEFENCEYEILYIGKSQGDIGGRVWAHMGLIYEPGTKEICNPRFKYHNWKDDSSVPQKIKDNLALGETVVYAIKVNPSEFYAESLEKYLLTCCYRLDRKLPILNKSF